MLALTIRRDQYGPPSRSVRLEDVPAPRLRPNDAKRVLVAILATGPNFNTNFAALGLPVPVFGKGDTASVHVPGSDALGIVVDAGPGVSTVKVGQAVILDSWTGRNIRGYETHDGFNAQFAVVDEERAVPVTGALRNHTPERLAAMLLTYGTAYRAVAERLSARPGDSVLVMGGGKGTSFPGAQIAKSFGARVLLVGSNPELARDLIARGMADAFVNRRSIPEEAFGAIPAGMPCAEWERRTEPFRRAVFDANGGKPVDKIFEHTGGDNFPLLVSALAPGGTLAFFGATGKGLKGEYKETFFHDGRRFVMDARWVWMRQKQVLFRRAKPSAIFDELGLPPGRRVLVWGADRSGREFVAAARARSAEVAVIASAKREKRGIAELTRMGVPPTHILDRDGFSLPEEMPDPLTPEGGLNPEYASGFTRPAQALGKALWKVFGPRVSPDVVVDRIARRRSGKRSGRCSVRAYPRTSSWTGSTRTRSTSAPSWRGISTKRTSSLAGRSSFGARATSPSGAPTCTAPPRPPTWCGSCPRGRSPWTRRTSTSPIFRGFPPCSRRCWTGRCGNRKGSPSCRRTALDGHWPITRTPSGGRSSGRPIRRAGTSSMCGGRATSPWLRSPVPMRSTH